MLFDAGLFGREPPVLVVAKAWHMLSKIFIPPNINRMISVPVSPA